MTINFFKLFLVFHEGIHDSLLICLRHGDVLDTSGVELYDKLGLVFFQRGDVKKVYHKRAVTALYWGVAQVIGEFFEVGAKQIINDFVVVDVFDSHIVIRRLSIEDVFHVDGKTYLAFFIFKVYDVAFRRSVADFF